MEWIGDRWGLAIGAMEADLQRVGRHGAHADTFRAVRAEDDL